VALLAALAAEGRADEPRPDAAHAPAGVPPAAGAHAGSPIAEALDRFDFGDYETVVTLLRPLVENGVRALPQDIDREEALRVYGIACTLTERRAAAEGAFLLLLRDDPTLRLDPRLVRPEAVAFYEEVRARHRDELLALHRRNRPRYRWYLNLLPAVGQLQNHQYGKAIAFGSVELTLLATTFVTYGLLTHYEGKDHTFASHGGLYEPLRDVNIVAFTALLTITTAGIIDALVIGRRRERRERDREARIFF
jgi:hypothetical protein